MLIRYGYEITLACQQPTALVCLLSVHEDRAADIRAPERPSRTPTYRYRPTAICSATDAAGSWRRPATSPCGAMRPSRTAASWTEYRPNAREMPVPELPDEMLVYLMGSRYCETDRLSQIAWDLFGTTPPGWGRVQTICDFVNNHIRFDYQQARSTRTAFDAYNERVGVCRDFAHLAVAFCRCLNIPARYVNGHLGDIGVPVVDPMDFSAWIEVFLDGEWHTFDPRNNVPQDRPHRGRARSRRHRHTAGQLVRAAYPERVSRLDLRGACRHLEGCSDGERLRHVRKRLAQEQCGLPRSLLPPKSAALASIFRSP